MTIKQKLADGRLVLGTIVSEVRNPNVAHMLARCGFEFFVLDCEHGAYNPETVSDMIAGARGAGIDVIVRIPEVRRETVLKPLDCGAAGLLVPMIDTAEQARELVRWAKYPPMGVRGVGLRRAHNRYERVRAGEYLKQANDAVFLAVQAETPEAIKNASDIAAVEGIDCVFAGPMDLSVSLGVPGRVDHPSEVRAIQAMIAACHRHNKAAGILSFDAAMLRTWLDRGVRFAVYSSDISMLADAASGAVRELRQSQGQA